MIKELLDNQFVAHHGVTTRGVSAVAQNTHLPAFDLDNEEGVPIAIKPLHEGKLTFTDNNETLEIAAYDHFFKQIKKPRSLAEGTKHCDYLMCSTHSHRHFLLIEITSTQGDVKNLTKPITQGRVEYGGGKFEKAQTQLSDSLIALLQVPAIDAFIAQFRSRVCLMAYAVTGKPAVGTARPFNRYLSIEAAEAGNNGAIIACPAIERHGFSYRRIAHPAPYSLLTD